MKNKWHLATLYKRYLFFFVCVSFLICFQMSLQDCFLFSQLLKSQGSYQPRCERTAYSTQQSFTQLRPWAGDLFIWLGKRL